jgi:hypothetical protein
MGSRIKSTNRQPCLSKKEVHKIENSPDAGAFFCPGKIIPARQPAQCALLLPTLNRILNLWALA